VAVGKLAAAKARNYSIPTAWIHHASLPRPRGLSVIALSSVADVGRPDAPAEGNVLLDRLAQQQPRGHLGGDRGSGWAGEADASPEGPRPDSTLLPTCHRSARGRPRGQAESRAPI
jgi:hypothetical protein